MPRDRSSARWGYGLFPVAVPAGVRRERSERALDRLAKKKNGDVAPIVIEGNKITRTFWGKAWCENLERYSDYENRLPRGRSYVRNRAVLDVRIEPQKIRALVQGSELYEVEIGISAIELPTWRKIVGECAGSIDSLVALLSGSLPDRVMEVVTRPGEGLFPTPREIELSCSCPDWATMCKHVAAVMYGVGAKLDKEPELLFRLRGADPKELTSGPGAVTALVDPSRVASDRRLEPGDLGEVFGIAFEETTPAPAPAASAPPRPKKKKRAAKSPARAITLARADLDALGVEPATIAAWLADRTLLGSEDPGRYMIAAGSVEEVVAHIVDRARRR
jgi:uncharacterized Zn finger protein